MGNILLDKDMNVKIADFGLSALINDDELLTGHCGSPNYAAPEMACKGCSYRGPEVDVWSCGVILYALLCKSLPFVADKMADLFEKIKRGRYTTPDFVTQEATDLLSRMLTVDVDDRITIRQIREHSWFRKDLPAYLEHSMDYAEHGTPEIATLRLRQ